MHWNDSYSCPKHNHVTRTEYSVMMKTNIRIAILLFAFSFRFQPEIWWANAQYDEADRYLKWPCSANFRAFYGTVIFQTFWAWTRFEGQRDCSDSASYLMGWCTVPCSRSQFKKAKHRQFLRIQQNFEFFCVSLMAAGRGCSCSLNILLFFASVQNSIKISYPSMTVQGPAMNGCVGFLLSWSLIYTQIWSLGKNAMLPDIFRSVITIAAIEMASWYYQVVSDQSWYWQCEIDGLLIFATKMLNCAFGCGGMVDANT